MKITVGLPLYKMKGIAWLAIESLCNQIEAPEWELIVIEEKSGSIGKKYFESNLDRLKKAGMTNFKYISLNKWMPLSQKWVELINHAKGEIFMLQSGDCYSQPYRLKETWGLRHHDWIQSNYGLFYDLNENKTILYNRNTYNHPCGLSMAFKTELGKGLKKDETRICVDSWLYNNIKPKSVGINNSKNWMLGLDTNGQNNLSKRKKYFDSPFAPFEQTELKPSENILKLINDRFNK